MKHRAALAAWLAALFASSASAADAANPNNYYCSEFPVEDNYTGECGAPCPTGHDTDCPDGHQCYGPLPNCAAALVTSFCGATQEEAADACAQGCEDDGECGDGEACWEVGIACSDEVLLAKERKETPNPFNHFCGASYAEALDECDTNYFAIPCQPELEDAACLPGTYCYGNLQCTPVEEEPDLASLLITTTTVPTVAETNSTESGEVANPNKMYCSQGWRGADYAEECGRPCPGGSNTECLDGEFCFGPQPNCIPKAYPKIRGGPKWCGTEYGDPTCSTECPGGTDDECGEGEFCFNESPCQFEPMEGEADASGLLWCARSYKHLVETCPTPCGPGESCGEDEDGNEMSCFNMEEEDEPCSTPGVGIKNATDPALLWCGSTWLNLVENCEKACPEGTDEECGTDWYGNPMKCFEMPPEEVCKKEGVGIKEKGDPNKRFCGTTYMDMMRRCPATCRDGVCPEGMGCFEDSPCLWVGHGLEVEEQDPAKMYCGDDYAEAARCGQPCPDGACPGGQMCFAEVTCSGKSDTSNLASLLWDDEDEEEEGEEGEETMPDHYPDPDEFEPAEEDPPEDAPSAEDSDPPAEDPPADDPPVDDPPADDPPAADDAPPADDPEPKPAQTDPVVSASAPDAESAQSSPASEPEVSNPPPTPVAESKPAPVAAETSSNNPPTPSIVASNVASSPSAYDGNPFGEVIDNDSTQSGVEVKNLRMALYGLDEFSATQLVSWEQHTSDFVDDWYNGLSSTNDVIAKDVKDVATTFDVTEVNISSNRRLLRRSLAVSSVYLVTYTLTIRYIAERDIGIGKIVQQPFSTPTKRNEYVKYLKSVEPNLFEDLSSVSAVFIPSSNNSVEVVKDKVEAPASSNAAAPVSSDAPASTKYEGFFCHNSGRACPSGVCAANDLCYFVPDESHITPIGAYTANDNAPQAAPSASSATNLVDLALGGSRPSPPAANPPSTYNGASMATDGARPPSPGPQSASLPQPTPTVSHPAHGLNAFGPTSVDDLEMTLRGVILAKAEHIFEWQYLTALYSQGFFGYSSPSDDYLAEKVSAVKASVEVTNLRFETSPMQTIVAFKQTSNYHASDSDISAASVATQPFALPEYREAYVSYLKSRLPSTFGDLETVSGVGTNPSPLDRPLIDTLFCSEDWPVDCASNTRCENGDDCGAGLECFTSLPSCDPSDDHQSPGAAQAPSPPSATNQNEVAAQPTQQQQMPGAQVISNQLDPPVQDPAPSAPASGQDSQEQQQQQPPQLQKPSVVSSDDVGTSDDPLSTPDGAVPAKNQPVSVPVSQQLPSSSSQDTTAVIEPANESDIQCDLCKHIGRVKRNAKATFNGRQLDCWESHRAIADNFLEASANCVTAQNNIANICCTQVAGTIESSATSSTEPAPEAKADTGANGASPSNPGGREPGGGNAANDEAGSGSEDPGWLNWESYTQNSSVLQLLVRAPLFVVAVAVVVLGHGSF